MIGIFLCLASREDLFGVTEEDVAVDCAVDEEDGDGGVGDGFFGGDGVHVEFVAGADVEEREFDEGAEEGASDPRSGVELLAHAVVADFAKAGERGFGCHGTEIGLGGKGLQELSGSHGLAESENAIVFFLAAEPIGPAVDVVAFEQAEGGERTVTDAVSAGVGEEDGVVVAKQELRVSQHAGAIVAQAVEEEDGVGVGLGRAEEPGAEGGAVGSEGDFDWVGGSIEGLGGVVGYFGGVRAGWMEGALAEEGGSY